MIKKISLIGAYCLLSAVVVFVAIAAFVQKSYIPEIKTPISISIKSSTSEAKFDLFDSVTDKARFDNFYNKVEKAFEESLITSIFNGNNFKKSRIECESTAPTFSTGYRMYFTYTEPQSIILNGKEFAYATDSSKILKYQQIIFELKPSQGFTENTMYYVVEETLNETKVTNYYKRTILANFDEVYKAIISEQS